MVIGISGKIRSGKNTTANIIQYVIDSVNNGYTLSEVNYNDYIKNNHYLKCNFQQKAFAGKLKQITALLTGCTIEQLESQEFKDSNLGPEWKRRIYTNPEKSHFINASMTYREVLQKIGTEAMRDNVHTDVWVNALFADYHPTPNKSMDESFMEQFVTGSSEIHYQLPNWIITDMRFPNEMDTVKAKGGITIRVNRKGFPITHSKTGETHLLSREAFVEHPSETSLDSHSFDYTIENNSSIEDLINKVKEILIKAKII